jgi:hypothetical protein
MQRIVELTIDLQQQGKVLITQKGKLVDIATDQGGHTDQNQLIFGLN